MEDITQKLRCPICLEVPIAEVFQCKNGHNLCSKCSLRVAHCPTCRVGFESPKIRCRVAEDMLDVLKFDCVYKQYGCKIKVSRKEILTHPETCAFRGKRISLCRLLGYSCDYLTWEMGLQQAEDHFVGMHNVQRCFETEFDIEIQGVINCGSGANPFFTAPHLLLQNKLSFTRLPGCITDTFLLHIGYNQAEKNVRIILVEMSSIREGVCLHPDMKKPDYALDIWIESNNPKEIPDIYLTAQPLKIEHVEFGAKNFLNLRIPYEVLLKFAVNQTVVITCSIERMSSVRNETKVIKRFVGSSVSNISNSLGNINFG